MSASVGTDDEEGKLADALEMMAGQVRAGLKYGMASVYNSREASQIYPAIRRSGTVSVFVCVLTSEPDLRSAAVSLANDLGEVVSNRLNCRAF